jgi:hypothetical protein
MRTNPKRPNPLQLRTLTLLQALARERACADPPEPDGTVSIHTLPHAHGDHFHVGPAVVSVRDATGLGNPNVLNALARKGLLLAGRTGLPAFTAEGLVYDTGIAAEILARRRPLELGSNLGRRAAVPEAAAGVIGQSSAVARTTDPEPPPLVFPARRQRPL